MKKIQKYKEAYKREMNEEMMWDVCIKKTGENDQWHIIKMARSRYWAADPFLIFNDGFLYLFYERFDRKRRIGEIAVAKIGDDFKSQEEKVVLSKQYHLSFPNVFELNGHYFMIPETQSNNSIEIYRCNDFPFSWEFYKTIDGNIQAVDTIVLEQNESSVVLLTSIIDGGSCIVENWKIYLDSDFNFVSKEKVKDFNDYGNRNAGKIFTNGGKKIRPGQDCRNGEYGVGIVFYEVSSSSEIEIAYKTPKDFGISNTKYDGCHTYNSSSLFETIDLRYTRKRTIFEKFVFFLRLGKNYVKRRLRH